MSLDPYLIVSSQPKVSRAISDEKLLTSPSEELQDGSCPADDEGTATSPIHAEQPGEQDQQLPPSSSGTRRESAPEFQAAVGAAEAGRALKLGTGASVVMASRKLMRRTTRGISMVSRTFSLEGPAEEVTSEAASKFVKYLIRAGGCFDEVSTGAGIFFAKALTTADVMTPVPSSLVALPEEGGVAKLGVSVVARSHAAGGGLLPGVVADVVGGAGPSLVRLRRAADGLVLPGPVEPDACFRAEHLARRGGPLGGTLLHGALLLAAPFEVLSVLIAAAPEAACAARDALGRTPLELAVETSPVTVVELLYLRAAFCGLSFHETIKTRETPRILAAKGQGPFYW